MQRADTLPDRRVTGHVGRGEIFGDGFRFHWHNIAQFDVYANDRVEYLPGPGWRNLIPTSFYSTVAAMLLAGRGLLPYHATALELNGRAFLFTGRGGAGKSTLAAEMLDAGARLISDDLTVLQSGDANDGFNVLRGRPGMRVHADTATRMEYDEIEHVTDDPRGKLLVRPKARIDDEPLPVSAIIMLAEGPTEVAATDAMHLLPYELFRRRWCSALPNHGRRKAMLLEMASRLPVRRFPPISNFDTASRRERLKRISELLSSLGAR